ncbi:DsbA family protein [Lacticaseibacillus nasuensis]|jgi:DNA polymerase III psi subunit|uniref:DsbA family protein n=1 Tax=Lacticaseibacillus nasuensis TaxID=944671 RepID=UPI0022454AD6|nr:DsbA family protein [Lacticaseibacillus nasuensis]MCX2454627.1 DsbA family protein [Lacticaseibacillus nasuensis]
MFEVFLFVNPIGTVAQQAELAVTQLAEELAADFTLHFVLLLSPREIDHVINVQGFNSHNLALRNQLFQAAYHIALDYKAAQFQGNHKARALLFTEQNLLHHNDWRYRGEFAAHAIAAHGIDPIVFSRDRKRTAMHDCFASDQKIAREMGITTTPAMVLFDNRQPGAPGMRIGNLESYDRLKSMCEQILVNPNWTAVPHPL